MEQQNKVYLTSDEAVLFDPNYRYQICTLSYKYIVQKGKNITVLENFSKFCQQLQFNSDTLIQIIGSQLSCKSGINKMCNLYYLQGKFEADFVNNVVYKFIKDVLLCKLCDKPEVILKIKNNQIKQKCKACGNNCYLQNTNDKINKYLNNNN
jgi:translation initiation factor 2 beta subunit (eIF-2beta)/eIF-5